GATIEHITITNGEVAFSVARDRVESRLSAINADATMNADRKINFAGTARAGDHGIKFDIKALMPAAPVERQTIPLDFAIDAPSLLQSQLSGHAEARLSGPVVMINGISGALGDGAFNGWASLDIASKPLVKLDLDFQRLDIPLSKSADGAVGQPW